MLPSEVIVETVEVALSRPTLVVRFNNALLFTVPVIGYDAAVGVPLVPLAAVVGRTANTKSAVDDFVK